ncbi:MAG: nuclear transport factor 2 family protein [Planctomycetes bacterium]|nr:nuclear transport factor 2 family protein [Planctomycetota bacterium]
MTTNLILVQSLYDAFAKGDVPAFLAQLDPEIRWNEAESFPYSDRNPYVGPAAIVQGVFQRILTDFEGFRVEVGELAGSGDVVTMFGRYKGQHAKTKRPLDVQCAHTWWIRNGKVVRFQQMVDTLRVSKTIA